MNAATRPPRWREQVRAVQLRPHEPPRALERGHLFDALQPGDVIVLNDAATLPGSLSATSAAYSGGSFEVRLASRIEDDRWWVVLFGPGDWRIDTNDRVPPPPLNPGDTLDIVGLPAVIESQSPLSPRLVAVRFDAPAPKIWHAIYTNGRPIQYSHLEVELDLWDVQTILADRPWAVEMPSAGRSLTWRELDVLRRRGIDVVSVTHAAGLSATGDPELDASLPLPERSSIPQETVDAIASAKRIGGRVVALGTSAARALEGRWLEHGELTAGDGVTDLRMGTSTPLRVVDRIVTGLHDVQESHFSLLEAFSPRPALERLLEVATAAGMRSHEFGDVCWVEAAS